MSNRLHAEFDNRVQQMEAKFDNRVQQMEADIRWNQRALIIMGGISMCSISIGIFLIWKYQYDMDKLLAIVDKKIAGIITMVHGKVEGIKATVDGKVEDIQAAVDSTTEIAKDVAESRILRLIRWSGSWVWLK